MSPEDLKKVLRLHALWLEDADGGKRADLRHANLYGADLYRANLCGADLRRANLSGAKGILLLPVSDPREYVCIAQWKDGEWLITSGCRQFTIAEARAHWGSGSYPDKSRAARYLMALDWLERWGDEARKEWKEK